MNTFPWPVRQVEAQSHLSAAGTLLPIEGPVLPLDTPVAVGRSLWGPFHRLCLQAQEGGHSHTIRSGPFTTEALPDGGLRIGTTLHVPTPTGAVRTSLNLRRAASGAMLEARMTTPEDADAAATAALGAMQAGLSTPAGGFVEARELRTGDMFPLGGAGGMPLLCRVLGQARHLGRAVVVARCAGTQAVAEAGWAATLTAEGHVAVDVATGMVILSALACRLAGGTDPDREFRLQAWVTLRQDLPAAA